MTNQNIVKSDVRVIHQEAAENIASNPGYGELSIIGSEMLFFWNDDGRPSFGKSENFRDSKTLLEMLLYEFPRKLENNRDSRNVKFGRY